MAKNCHIPKFKFSYFSSNFNAVIICLFNNMLIFMCCLSVNTENEYIFMEKGSIFQNFLHLEDMHNLFFSSNFYGFFSSGTCSITDDILLFFKLTIAVKVVQEEALVDLLQSDYSAPDITHYFLLHFQILLVPLQIQEQKDLFSTLL
jgi:hypothetical protein